MMTSRGIMRIEASDARHHQVLHGLRPEGRQRVDLLGHAHRPELRRHRASHAARHHERGQNGRELAREREGDDAADQALRVEAREAVTRSGAP